MLPEERIVREVEWLGRDHYLLSFEKVKSNPVMFAGNGVRVSIKRDSRESWKRQRRSRTKL